MKLGDVFIGKGLRLLSRIDAVATTDSKVYFHLSGRSEFMTEEKILETHEPVRELEELHEKPKDPLAGLDIFPVADDNNGSSQAPQEITTGDYSKNI